ncbi:hypothetical protein As57867_007584, partial [Aphanomyces stellatus]
HLERIAMLKRAEYHVQDIATFCMDAIEIRKSRAATLDEVHEEKKRKRELDASTVAADAATDPDEADMYLHVSTRPRMFLPACMEALHLPSSSSDESDNED